MLGEACEGGELKESEVHPNQTMADRRRGRFGKKRKRQEMDEGRNRKEKIQTDGQRHRSTEESSAWFATRFIGDSL